MNHAALSRQLNYQFKQPDLLQRALTHRSYSTAHYERLEFLGDSVLNCAIAKYLYEHHPNLPEGDLSRLRSNLVNQHSLYRLAQDLNLGDFLLLGEGERKSAGFRRPSILADTLEAIFGAVFLDGGFEVAEQCVLKLYIPFIAEVDLHSLGKDPKTQLQEALQGRKLPLPYYAVVETQGEAHAQNFVVECKISALKIISRGEGSSRRIAEQAAAEVAYNQLNVNNK
jgi:ribonuclease-3